MSHAIPVNPSEVPIVELAEVTSLAKLLEESRPQMLAMIERRTDDKIRKRRCAGDVYQQACAQALHRWPEFPNSGMSEKTWLYRIVLNCLGDDRDVHIAIKRDARAEVIFPECSSLQIVQGIFDRNPGPQTEAQRREESELRCQRVSEILMQLNPMQREVLCMRFYDELSHWEIGEILGVSEVAARRRFSRAMVEFHDHWMEQFGASGNEP